MKKQFPLTFAILMTSLFLLSQVAGAQFTDVTSDHQYYTSISWMIDNDIVEGYGDGTFRPSKDVNRVEFLKMVYLAQGLANDIPEVQTDSGFSDVDPYAWYTKYVAFAKDRGTIEGYSDGTFRPAKTINRAEAFKIIMKEFFGSEANNYGGTLNCNDLELKDIESGAWYEPFIRFSHSKCIFPSSMIQQTSASPALLMNRGEIAEAVYRSRVVSDNSGQAFEEDKVVQPTPAPTTEPLASNVIQPSDLIYRGAFRLPGESSGIKSWAYGGDGMTYYPYGDPGGPNDGYAGSLYGTGHAWEQQISEISIPAPVISASKNINDLNVASTLQNFTDLKKDLGVGYLEIPHTGLAYLPKQGSQTTDKLHFTWGQHYQDGEKTHGWAELDLSNPQTAGGWYLGNQLNYSSDDYLFDIPKSWADTYTPGKLLATGRFRDGGWSGQGPSLFAYGPSNQGNPPPDGTRLDETTLLLYSTTYYAEVGGNTLDNYHHGDEWAGAAWLTADDKAAVIFTGTKGTGVYWYGFGNGVVWPDAAPYPEIPDPPYDSRGWWSTGFKGQILFYDPSDLAAVARGTMEPHEPQPYATMDLDDYFFRDYGPQDKFHTGAAAFDRKRGLLYVFERFADEAKPIVHVWEIK